TTIIISRPRKLDSPSIIWNAVVDLALNCSEYKKAEAIFIELEVSGLDKINKVLIPHFHPLNSPASNDFTQTTSLKHNASHKRRPDKGVRWRAEGPEQPSWPCYVFNLEHRSEEHTSELQSRENLVCRLLLEKKKK